MSKSLNEVLGNAASYVAVSGTDAFATSSVRVLGFTLRAGTDAAVLSVYDATSTSGSAAFSAAAAAGDSVVLYLGPNGVRFANGLHGAVTGTSPAATLFYVVE